MDYSDNWFEKDVLIFKGKINPDDSLLLHQFRKRSNFSFELIYSKFNVEAILSY